MVGVYPKGPYPKQVDPNLIEGYLKAIGVYSETLGAYLKSIGVYDGGYVYGVRV